METIAIWFGIGIALLCSFYAAFIKKPKCKCENRVKILENTAARVMDVENEKVDCIITHPTKPKIIYELLKEKE